MLDTSKLDAAIEAANAQATATETIEAGALAVIQAQGAATAEAVTAALAADNINDQAVIDRIVGAVTGTTARFAASAGPLGAAIATPAPPTP